jgi:hypothetical protein
MHRSGDMLMREDVGSSYLCCLNHDNIYNLQGVHPIVLIAVIATKLDA